MNTAGVKFEVLNKSNYDTWKIQVRAILIKNDAWGYVSGANKRPEISVARTDVKYASEIQAQQEWDEADLKAQSDLILAISPSETKQIKTCTTSNAIWKKLQEIYQSTGPIRKSALLNEIMSMHMDDEGDVREHIENFFDIIDKLSDMDTKMDNDVLSVMLLRSLPDSFENFRCAVQSRDALPHLETLRIKIVEEFDARKAKGKDCQNAMIACGRFKSRSNNKKYSSDKRDAKMKCFICQAIGHRAKNCPQTKNGKKVPEGSRFTSAVALHTAEAPHAVT